VSASGAGWPKYLSRQVGAATSVQGVLEALGDMPWSLARPRVWQQAKAAGKVILHVAQDFGQGETLASEPNGSSRLVQLLHRLASEDASFACYDVLPINHDFKWNVDSFIKCASCRLENLEAVDGKRGQDWPPTFNKQCKGCTARHECLLDWMSLQLIAQVKMESLAAEKLFVVLWGRAAQLIWDRVAGQTSKDWNWVKSYLSLRADHPAAICRSETKKLGRKSLDTYRKLLDGIMDQLGISPPGAEHLETFIAQLGDAYDPARKPSRPKALAGSKKTSLGSAPTVLKKRQRVVGGGRMEEEEEGREDDNDDDDQDGGMSLELLFWVETKRQSLSEKKLFYEKAVFRSFCLAVSPRILLCFLTKCFLGERRE
jgi:hypothetical protein